MILTLHDYLIDQTREKLLFDASQNQAAVLARTLKGLDKNGNVQKDLTTNDVLLGSALHVTEDGRVYPVQILGVVDSETGRIYATPPNKGAFEETPELTINRMAAYKVGGVYHLDDPFNGKEDLEKRVLRLNYPQSKMGDLNARVALRTLRFMVQHNLEPVKHVKKTAQRIF